MMLTPDEIRTMRASALLHNARDFWQIVDEVCAVYDVPRKCLSDKARGSLAVNEARQFICLYAIRRGLSSVQIGKWLGRDHSTIAFAARQAAAKEADRSGGLTLDQ